MVTAEFRGIVLEFEVGFTPAVERMDELSVYAFEVHEGNRDLTGRLGQGFGLLGDLVGPPWLAHKAMHEGVLVVEKIAGVKGVHPMKTENIPGCTYCQPQVASIGLTEAAAKAKEAETRKTAAQSKMKEMAEENERKIRELTAEFEVRARVLRVRCVLRILVYAEEGFLSRRMSHTHAPEHV